MKRTYYVESNGDPEVGIPGFQATVTFDDELDWNGDYEDEERAWLAEYYDVKPSMVLNEQQKLAADKQEEEWMKEQERQAKEDKLLEVDYDDGY